jgi:hypothetical protein
MTKGTPTEQAQYIIWMEFYGEESDVQFEDVNVVTLTDFGQMWTAYVWIPKEETLYHIRHYRGTGVVGIEMYNKADDRILTIK